MCAKLAVKIVGYVVKGRAFSRIQETRESDVGESGRSKFGEARDSLFQKTGRCGEGVGGKQRDLESFYHNAPFFKFHYGNVEIDISLILLLKFSYYFWDPTR